MISLVFRIALIVCSILTTVFMIKKIRNSKLQIEHAIFCDNSLIRYSKFEISIVAINNFIMTIKRITKKIKLVEE